MAKYLFYGLVMYFSKSNQCKLLKGVYGTSATSFALYNIFIPTSHSLHRYFTELYTSLALHINFTQQLLYTFTATSQLLH